MFSLTDFPHGISSMGVPILGASDGLMTQGTVFFVKPNSGSDGNDGKSMDRALKTLSKAQTLATADKNDVVYFVAESNTAASTTDYQSANLAWAKDLVHLVGVCAPSSLSQRARIAQLSTATAVTNLVTVSGDACIIRNIQIFQGVADATSLVALLVSGQRNVFINCHIAGMGHNDIADDASGRSLKVTGAENRFVGCHIGLDTIARSAANAEIEMSGSAGNVIFEDCYISSWADAATHLFVTATALNRYAIFKNCIFMNNTQIGPSSAMTEGFNVAAINGFILIKDCSAIGMTDWEAATVSGLMFVCDGGAPSTTASGLSVAVAAS